MRRYAIGLIAISIAILLFAACTPEKWTDKTKYTEVNRTVQDLQTAIASGKPCDVPDTVLQDLDTKTESLKEKAVSQNDRDLIAASKDLASIYRDGLLLCRSRTHLTSFPFVPKGRIYVTQELDPVVEKYGLSTERHQYKPTGQYWRSIDADSIQLIWERAGFRIRYIENMLKYY